MELLNVTQVAEVLGVSKRTVYRLRSEGELPSVQIPGRRLARWKRRTVERYVERLRE